MSTQTLCFEIGTEELPAFDLHNATLQLEKLAATSFDNAGISYGEISVYSTPRRLILLVSEVPETTQALDETIKGPAARIAFDEGGNPTKAALGFARKQGVEPTCLERREENGTEYVFAIKHTPAKRIADMLPDILHGLITGLSWPRPQRWGSYSDTFRRPVRWLLALLGSEVVNVKFAGLSAANTTRGHRFLAPGPFGVANADCLLDVLRGAYVVPSEAEREAEIRKQIASIEEKLGLVAELPAKVMAEVINLVEYPTVMVGEFDELFLAVPKEIIVDAMLVHQRYFPLFTKDGALTNKFIVTSNGDAKFEANIIDGNQRVVAARLYDAKFFYDEDLKKPLEAYVDDLENVVFQEALGTTRAKVSRIETLAGYIASQAGFGEQDVTDSKRAAYLAKADLVTSAVVEFTSVQGIMGSYYAKAAGETEQVAQAIADHYKPRFAGDTLPASLVGKVVACADKIDTICGLFAVNQAPTGSSDPFALRRQAIGVINILDSGLAFSLVDAISEALSAYASNGIEFDKDAVREQVIDFFVTRTKVNLRDAGASQDAIDAVLATGIVEPAVIMTRVRALENARASKAETFDDLATAYARANNLRDASCGENYDSAIFNEIESSLANVIAKAKQDVESALVADDYETALQSLADLRKPIDAFFDGVMVMDEDARVRENRLRLLNSFVSVFANVADFGLMAKSK
jgi:glycyl-tRNA synthetase beta chain